jgi:hypothetical protein
VTLTRLVTAFNGLGFGGLCNSLLDKVFAALVGNVDNLSVLAVTIFVLNVEWRGCSSGEPHGLTPVINSTSPMLIGAMS